MCGTSALIIIGQSSPIAATHSVTPVMCNNTYTGAITINPSIPASYTYSIGTTGVYQPSNTFNSLRAGTYRLTIKDAGGCKTSISNIVVNQPTAVAIVVNSVNNPNNAAQNNGSIAVSGTGGAVGGYLFKFGTGGTYQSSGVFNNLKAGSYRIFIKDANECAGASYAVTLTATPQPRSNGIVKERQASSGIGIGESISMFPNPTTSAFKVSFNGTKNEAVNIRVINVDGKVVYTTSSRTNQTLTFGEALSTGMYMVEVRQGKEVKILKAIKIK